MSSKKKTDKRMVWVRVLCIVLAFLMVGGTLLAALDIF